MKRVRIDPAKTWARLNEGQKWQWTRYRSTIRAVLLRSSIPPARLKDYLIEDLDATSTSEAWCPSERKQAQEHMQAEFDEIVQRLGL